jgi:hypothetical protein
MFRPRYVQARARRKRARAILQCAGGLMVSSAAVNGDQRELTASSRSRGTSRTSRGLRCAGSRVRAAVLQPGGAEAAVRADYRTSSNTRVDHPPGVRSARNHRRALLRSWASIWFAPRRGKRSAGWQIRTSSSGFFREIGAVRTLLNWIGPPGDVCRRNPASRQKKAIVSIPDFDEQPACNPPFPRAAKSRRIRQLAGLFLAVNSL